MDRTHTSATFDGIGGLSGGGATSASWHKRSYACVRSFCRQGHRFSNIYMPPKSKAHRGSASPLCRAIALPDLGLSVQAQLRRLTADPEGGGIGCFVCLRSDLHSLRWRSGATRSRRMGRSPLTCTQKTESTSTPAMSGSAAQSRDFQRFRALEDGH